MSYENTYRIPWTVELRIDGMNFINDDAFLMVDVEVDSGGDVSGWTVSHVGPVDLNKTCWAAGGPHLDKYVSFLNRKKPKALDEAICESVAEDEDAPRPRSDRAEHGTHYVGGAL